MRKLIYILLIVPVINLMGQWPDEYFDLHFVCDFEKDAVGAYTIKDFNRDWHHLGWFASQDNVEIEQKGSTKAMRFNYAEGTSNLGDTHGAKFHAYFDAIGTQYEEIYFSYDIMFKPGYDFVRSGKTPNLNIGERWPTDHSYPYYDEGSSAGIRWSGNKDGDSRYGAYYFYIYSHNRTWNDEETGELVQYTWGPAFRVPDNPSLYWVNHPTEEKWINVTLRVVMNSTNAPPAMGDKNGIFEAFINGKLAASVDTVIWRNIDDHAIKIMKIYSQFGGLGDIFNTTRDEWILTDNYRAWTYKESVTNVPRGRQKSQWGRTLNMPASWSHVINTSEVPNGDGESLSIPSDLEATAVTESSVSLKWNVATDNTAVTGYRIFVNNILDGASTTKTHTVTGLSPSTEYSISVSAIDAAGNESKKSDPILVTTKNLDITPPTIPTGVGVSGVTGNSINLTWAYSSDNVVVSGYNIFLNGTRIGSSINNAFLISELQPNTIYNISVSAFDPSGNESAQSNPIQIRTGESDNIPPSAPNGLSAILVADRSISMVWNASSDNIAVTGYRIIANGLRKGTSYSNSYTLTELNPGITYNITITAYDAAGNESTSSNQISVKTNNPDVTVQSTLPEIELVDLKKSAQSVQTISNVKSFGYIEVQDYGVLVSENQENILGGDIIFGLPDSTSVIFERRVEDGLEVMYDFSKEEENVIHDINETHNNLNLQINKVLNTRWLPGQGLMVSESTIIATDESPNELIDILQKTGEISVEAWVKSSETNQAGPASIITLSNGSNECIFTLGQTGNQSFYDYVVRLNTTQTNANEIPEIATNENFLIPALHHVIYTRDKNGNEKVFVNGFETYSGTRVGDLSSWGSEYHLALANESTGNRPWLGTFFLVAIYSKALSYQEVNQNYYAGFGTLQFKSDIEDLEPNVPYYISPFVRTDQGIVYGGIERVEIENIRISNQVEEIDTLLMSVFPNPTNGVFTVEFEDKGKSANKAIIHVADQAGKIVFVKEYLLPNGIYYGEETLDLTGILKSKGFFIVKVIMDSKSAASKLFII